MDYRYLGASGLKVPVLGFGISTFGGMGFPNAILPPSDHQRIPESP